MAVTCNSCGYAYNDDGASKCSICNSPLNVTQNIVSAQLTLLAEQSTPLNSPSDSNGDVVVENTTAAQTTSQQNGQNSLLGRISHLERFDEKPPLDVYNVLAKILLGILVLVPYCTLFLISGLLSFSFAVIGFQSLSQLFNPIIWSTSIFELLELIVLRRFRGGDTVPIYRGMIEDNSGQEYSFLFRGPLNAGNLVVGHNVDLNGQWQRGSFIVRQGSDLSSNSQISSSCRNPWRVIFFVTFVLVLTIGMFVAMNWQQITGLVM